MKRYHTRLISEDSGFETSVVDKETLMSNVIRVRQVQFNCACTCCDDDSIKKRTRRKREKRIRRDGKKEIVEQLSNTAV